MARRNTPHICVHCKHYDDKICTLRSTTEKDEYGMLHVTTVGDGSGTCGAWKKVDETTAGVLNND